MRSRGDELVIGGFERMLVLALGTVLLRTDIERHLPGPLTATDQLERWQASVNTLLREGLFRQTGD
jgi:hypothetical protein